MIRWIILLTGLLIWSGCTSYFAPVGHSPARLGKPSPMHKNLVALPDPQKKVHVAVYRFRDQTGQYKQTANGNSFSTVVTQGATSILLRALQESGWFIPIEREGLSNLLNERKIINRGRMLHKSRKGKKLPPLPPLMYAGVLLEGGIIAYDSNVLTGGMGAKYFGAGGSAQYRRDRVTIYLRAISTRTGQILKTVYTTKTILSQMVEAGLHRFVNFKRLLEVETGFSYNEPPEMCVTEAIEKAVQSLVIEGVFEGLWKLRRPSDRHASVIRRYLEEKAALKEGEMNAVPLEGWRKRYGLGIRLAAQKYIGDYAEPRITTAWGADLKIRLNPYLSGAITVSRGLIADKHYFETTINMAEIKGIYYLIPWYRWTPYLSLGGGIWNTNPTRRSTQSAPTEWLLGFNAGIGMEYFVTTYLALNIILDNRFSFDDTLDGMEHGQWHDYFWGTRIGLTLYLGD